MDESNCGTLENTKIVIIGGAGLVGQNLMIKLLANGFTNLHVLDKASHNLMLGAALADVDVVVLLHAQIGGIAPDAFHRNNVVATESVLSA